MFRFFRRIRKSIVNSSQARKYILYAAGEVLLIMLGILLALQVNNWNIDKKTYEEEKSILENFEVTLQNDLQQLLFHLNLHNRIDSSIGILLDHLENNANFHDSLKYHFGNTTFTPSLQINLSVFETLKSYNLSLISNEELRESIITFYHYFITEVEGSNKRYADIIQFVSLNLFETRFHSFWESNYEVWKNDKVLVQPEMVPLNFESLKTDTEYIYFLKSLANRRVFLVHNHIDFLIPAINNLIRDINNELDK